VRSLLKTAASCSLSVQSNMGMGVKLTSGTAARAMAEFVSGFAAVGVSSRSADLCRRRRSFFTTGGGGIGEVMEDAMVILM